MCWSRKRDSESNAKRPWSVIKAMGAGLSLPPLKCLTNHTDGMVMHNNRVLDKERPRHVQKHRSLKPKELSRMESMSVGLKSGAH